VSFFCAAIPKTAALRDMQLQSCCSRQSVCQTNAEMLSLNEVTIWGWYKTHREGGWGAFSING